MSFDAPLFDFHFLLLVSGLQTLAIKFSNERNIIIDLNHNKKAVAKKPDIDPIFKQLIKALVLGVLF